MTDFLMVLLAAALGSSVTWYRTRQVFSRRLRNQERRHRHDRNVQKRKCARLARENFGLKERLRFREEMQEAFAQLVLVYRQDPAVNGESVQMKTKR
jgi:hypothetical protein